MIIARWYHRIRESDIHDVARHLRTSQFWPLERIRRYQFDKLEKLLRHACLHVPYYRRIFEDCGATPNDIRSFDDFAKLPILTKASIRENFDDLVARNTRKEELLPSSTGGSTGEPLRYYHDQQYRTWAEAARIRGWYEIAGVRNCARCAVLWGATKDVKSDFSLKERLRHFCRDGEIMMNSFNLSEQRKVAFLKWCRVLRPKLLRGYFTAIKDFAAFLDENNLKFPRLRGIILCAETVDEHSRAYIDRVFRTTSYNIYGGRELSLTAMECEARNGLHEVSENNYVEFEPIELADYSNAGNLIVTNLNNYAMPFIRYRIGDIGIPGTQDTCSCGRGLPLIAKVIGRTTEVFNFYDGTRIAGEMFIHLMKDCPLKEYQFVQVSDKRVVLKMTQGDAGNKELQTRIRNTYRSYLPTDVILDFEAVDHFNRTPTGKFRFVFKQTPE